MYSLILITLAAVGIKQLHGDESGSSMYCDGGDIRLVDGFGDNGGRVEFCFNGEWGSVCSDDWDANDADVVCRQLGIPTTAAYALTAFGGGNGSIFIDNARCTGNEQRLEDCVHNGIGNHDCSLDHSNDAGVFCDTNVNETCTLQETPPNQECYNDVPPLTRSCLQRQGNCVPYRALETSSPCDVVFESGVDYVYVSYERFDGSFSQFMKTIVKFGPQLLSALESCYDTAVKVICHFYLPPCGNATHFQPPTSVCSETCYQLRDLCPVEWDLVVSTFEENRILLEADGLLFIECDNPGHYLSPLPHCCSNAGVNTSVTPLMNITSKNNTPRSNSAAVITYTYVLGPVIGLVLFILCTVGTIGLYRYRLRKSRDLLISNPIPLGSVKERTNSLNKYIEPSNAGNTLEVIIKQGPGIPRVTSGYIRQMARDNLLILAEDIELMGNVGQGEFGVVYRATLSAKNDKNTELVAVKTLKGAFTSSELDALVEESVIMSRFDHRNVMKLIGVSIENIYNTLYIVMPYMTNGSLLAYLRKHRAELTIENDDDTELVDSTCKKLLSMCLQITKGMQYLASQKFVHRDLAARNCMIDHDFVIKVSDFGLSEDIYARNYFRQGMLEEEGEAPVKLPIKWMALESLNDCIFSERTDVWSFGVTCWEVFSLGKNPYPGVDPFTLIRYLERGERLDKPLNAACYPNIYSIMMDCWMLRPTDRPTFAHLVNMITASLEEIAGYIDFTSLH